MTLPLAGACVSIPIPTLRLEQTQGMAWQFLSKYGLHDWSFRFNRSKCNLGLCRFGPRVIELSVYFVERNSLEAIQDTLLHEIAHALVGPGHGHDLAWRNMCRRVGARPERQSFEADMPAGRWQARCKGCGMLHHKHRRPKHMRGWWCVTCGRERGQLTWECA